MSTVYLIGINHSYQIAHKDYGDKPEKLRQLLMQLVEVHAPASIAEEYNGEAKVRFGAATTIAESVAKKHKLNHYLCEPNRSRRKLLGILGDNGVIQKFYSGSYLLPNEDKWPAALHQKRREDFAKREKHWLKVIKRALGKDIIFICGSDHVHGFTRKLDDLGHSVVVTNIK